MDELYSFGEWQLRGEGSANFGSPNYERTVLIDEPLENLGPAVIYESSTLWDYYLVNQVCFDVQLGWDSGGHDESFNDELRRLCFGEPYLGIQDGVGLQPSSVNSMATLDPVTKSTNNLIESTYHFNFQAPLPSMRAQNSHDLSLGNSQPSISTISSTPTFKLPDFCERQSSPASSSDSPRWPKTEWHLEDPNRPQWYFTLTLSLTKYR